MVDECYEKYHETVLIAFNEHCAEEYIKTSNELMGFEVSNIEFISFEDPKDDVFVVSKISSWIPWRT